MVLFHCCDFVVVIISDPIEIKCWRKFSRPWLNLKWITWTTGSLCVGKTYYTRYIIFCRSHIMILNFLRILCHESADRLLTLNYQMYICYEKVPYQQFPCFRFRIELEDFLRETWREAMSYFSLPSWVGCHIKSVRKLYWIRTCLMNYRNFESYINWTIFPVSPLSHHPQKIVQSII